MSIEKPTAEMVDLLRKTGSPDREVAIAAQRALALALTGPLRQGVLTGDLIANIFTPEPLEPGATPEYPLDFYAPGTEGEFKAYTIPSEGAIPMRHIEGDYVTVQTYDVGNSIDWLLKYSRQARWNIVARALQVLEAGFVKKFNDDGWHTILAAAKGRAFVAYDSDAATGQFTKKLVSVMKTVMRRHAGGNSTSMGRSNLTDLYISPEALEDIRDWGQIVDNGTDNTSVLMNPIDPQTMREIMVSPEGTITRLYGVNLHDIDELGVSQEYNEYYKTTLGGTMGSSSADTEVVVGFDLGKRDSFVMPIKENVTIFEDPALHRRRRAGFYAWGEVGFACLDDRRVIAGTF